MRLDAVVERLHRLEVAVDDDVEQAVHQRADAVLLAAELVEALSRRSRCRTTATAAP